MSLNIKKKCMSTAATCKKWIQVRLVTIIFAWHKLVRRHACMPFCDDLVIGNVVQYEEAEIDRPVFRFFSFHFYMYSPDGQRLDDLINILVSFWCHLLYKVQHFISSQIKLMQVVVCSEHRDHNAWFWRRWHTQSLCFWKANCETFVVRSFSCLFNSL